MRDITHYGAVGDGVTDCTPAFAAAALDGGAIRVPSGRYRVTATADACIVATKPLRLVGDSLATSIIVPDAATPATVDCLTFRPPNGGLSDGWGLHDIAICPAVPGAMRAAVRIDLNAPGSYLARATFERIAVTAGTASDSAFWLDKPSGGDGLFCGEITGKSIIFGGVKLINLGDSFAISGATITGPNVGVHAVGVPGAAQCKVLDCNITSSAGAIFLESMNQAKIIGNQCEQPAPYTGVLNGMVVLSACNDCDVDANNLNSHGLTNCVIIENGAAHGNILSRNAMSAGTGFYHLMVGAGCPGNALRVDNRFYSGDGSWGAPCKAINDSSPLWPI